MITDGQAEISGNFTQDEARDLANVLKYGALPLTFDPSEVQESLGQARRRPAQGRHLGRRDRPDPGRHLLACCTTAASASSSPRCWWRAVLTYGVVVLLGKALGFTLSLPGIAGLIVAIGITADSFVVYFERIRDEVRDGAPCGPRSRPAGPGPGGRSWPRTRSPARRGRALHARDRRGRGFAFALGLTTLIDLIVVFLFTKPLVTVLARTKFFGQGHPLSGLDPKHLGVAAAPNGTRGAGLSPAGRRPDDQVRGTLGARLYRGEVSYDFIGKRKLWYTFSLILWSLSIAARRPRADLGIEFRGGAEFPRQVADPTTARTVRDATSSAARSSCSDHRRQARPGRPRR